MSHYREKAYATEFSVTKLFFLFNFRDFHTQKGKPEHRETFTVSNSISLLLTVACQFIFMYCQFVQLQLSEVFLDAVILSLFFRKNIWGWHYIKSNNFCRYFRVLYRKKVAKNSKAHHFITKLLIKQ